MTMHRLFAVGLIGALAVSACTRPAEEAEQPAERTTPIPTAPTVPSAPPIGYACESGQTVTVQYPDTATAQVAYRNQTYAMRLAPSPSGARYSGSGLEWWIATQEGGGQETATLSRLGPNEDVGVAVLERCSRPSTNPTLPAPGTQPLPGGPVGTTPTAATPCRASQLRLASDSGDAGAGNRVNVFSVTNAGTTACSVSGYPAVSLLDGQGRALTAVRSDQNPNTATPVVIPANGKAFFDIAWNVVPNEAAGQRTCPTAARVIVRIPGDTAALAVPLGFTPCGGRIRVNPFRSAVDPVAQPVAGQAGSST